MPRGYACVQIELIKSEGKKPSSVMEWWTFICTDSLAQYDAIAPVDRSSYAPMISDQVLVSVLFVDF